MTDLPLCPCGSGIHYAQCCAPYHQGLLWPETAEKLMRSRYCAYVQQVWGYLVKTHHPQQRKRDEQSKIQAWAQDVTWLGLEILDVRAGGPEDKQGKVEFKAQFILKGKNEILHERSRFKRYQGKWHYWDGVIN